MATYTDDVQFEECDYKGKTRFELTHLEAAKLNLCLAPNFLTWSLFELIKNHENSFELTQFVDELPEYTERRLPAIFGLIK